MQLLVDKTELKQITTLSPTTVWRLEKKGLFPKRRILDNRRVAWLYSDIVDWVTNLKAA